jgi:hypothetical protein
MQAEGGTCTSCYGQGELVTEQGPVACPDCYGEPNLKGRAELLEWRLRDLERNCAANVQAAASDVSWLVFQIRRHRDALTRIITRCQEGDAPEALVAELQHLANAALELYPVEKVVRSSS